MENPNSSFFDILDRVVNKAIDLAEKSAKDSGPVFTSTLSTFEQWLDSKLDKPSSS